MRLRPLRRVYEEVQQAVAEAFTTATTPVSATVRLDRRLLAIIGVMIRFASPEMFRAIGAGCAGR